MNSIDPPYGRQEAYSHISGRNTEDREGSNVQVQANKGKKNQTELTFHVL